MTPSASRRVVLGTAGHIDHGKTSLVKALTGIDTDRLREEKERGITIELGFAHLRLPSGVSLSIVDVPGHERFVRTMVAGATGIDMVLLVIAADEGVMPQTREHLDICTLLRVKSGLIALTKADLVDDDFLELAREDVAEAVRGTFLEDAPIVPVSSTSGQGLPELVSLLDRLANEVPQKSAHGLFRLPVDRVFTIRGFGTVVTGTAISGSVRKEDEVELLPRGLRAKVRGIQVQGQAAEKALAGQRTALNLSGAGIEDLDRGDTVTHPGSLRPTYMVDARLELLPSGPPLARRVRCRLHTGTQEVPVLVALLDREECKPGEGAYVQIRAAQKLIVCPGDRFVLRAFSPARTIGGGVVLDHRPKRHKGSRPELVADLEILDRGEPEQRLEVLLRARGPAGMDPVEAQGALGISLEDARNLLQAGVRKGWAAVAARRSQRHVHGGAAGALEGQALAVLEKFHAENPLRKGINTEELRSKFPAYVDSKLVEFVLSRLVESRRVVLEGELVRLASFTVTLSAGDEAIRGRVVETIAARGYEAPSAEEIAAALGENAKALGPVLEYLVSQGLLIRTKEGYFFVAERIADFVRAVVERLREKGELGVADVKELTGTSRKHTIPLLEYLDSNRVTVRKGDVRVAGPKGKG
ncbi:MAG: selenocysteine-specific translation elongation factor [Deltaproteobacteria bacterium]|nr:selenocysteine-specific translation elongation factor [Deltaproteobacteria bacterium]